MLTHHDAREYRTAVDETAGKFHAELQKIVADGAPRAAAIMARVQNEIPDDAVVTAGAAEVVGLDGFKRLALRAGDFERPFHRHALRQIADRTGIPDLYVTRLEERGEFGRELLRDNLNRLLHHNGGGKARYLIRSVAGEVRGVLSDTYRRMDSRPILDAFAGACDEVGAVPVDGVGGDLRFSVRAVLPIVFRPGGDEILAFGVELSNSDFGCGALSVKMFALRVWCTNFARLEEELRKIHLGKRLGEEIRFSEETYQLDTRAMASATRDIVRGVLAPAKVNETVTVIERAMAEKIDTKAALGNLPKLGLLRGEAEEVADVFRNGGVEKLPPGDTTYRLSNAVSWVAKAAETAERRMELEQVAGEILLKAAA